jgi:hypothetical protein
MMRGVEPTTGTRAYRSDAAQIVAWCAALNRREPAGKSKTCADVLRAIIAENRRQKQRIAYLEFDNAQMGAQIKQYQRDVKKCLQFRSAQLG